MLRYSASILLLAGVCVAAVIPRPVNDVLSKGSIAQPQNLLTLQTSEGLENPVLSRQQRDLHGFGGHYGHGYHGNHYNHYDPYHHHHYPHGHDYHHHDYYDHHHHDHHYDHHHHHHDDFAFGIPGIGGFGIHLH